MNASEYIGTSTPGQFSNSELTYRVRKLTEILDALLDLERQKGNELREETTPEGTRLVWLFHS